MGMMSYFVEEDIEVKDEANLREYLLDFMETHKAQDYFVTDGLGIEKEDLLNKKKKLDITFQGFNEWKIISYWYGDFVCFFRDLAVFIEGFVKWSFETEDECATIHFEDGKAVFEIGVMEYKKFTPNDLAKKGREGYFPMSKKVKSNFVARQL